MTRLWNNNLCTNEQLEETRLKLHTVTEDQGRLNREVSELMGHQNTHQKIKHINQLKQNSNRWARHIYFLNILPKLILCSIDLTWPRLVDGNPFSTPRYRHHFNIYFGLNVKTNPMVQGNFNLEIENIRLKKLELKENFSQADRTPRKQPSMHACKQASFVMRQKCSIIG